MKAKENELHNAEIEVQELEGKLSEVMKQNDAEQRAAKQLSEEKCRLEAKRRAFKEQALAKLTQC